MTQTRLRHQPRAVAARRAAPIARFHHPDGWELVALAADGTLSQVFRARAAGARGAGLPAYALKLLRPQWQDDSRVVAMLAREALVGRTIRHPHVVSVLAASLGDGPRFVVMPWLDGCTLRQYAAAQPPELPEALWFIRQAAQGLAAMHEAGWMHGDIKPSNLFIGRDGHLTLLDLGLARSCQEKGSPADGGVVGTRGYMAPEWLSSPPRADIRSDIYSLGVVLHELLVGRPPFEAGGVALSEQRKALPATVTSLVRRMLAKDPLRRPQAPADLVGEIAALEVATFTRRGLEKSSQSPRFTEAARVACFG